MRSILGYAILAVGGLAAFTLAANAEPLSPAQAIPDADADTPERTGPLFQLIKGGPIEISLEETTLGDVEKAFGGTMHDEGDAGDSSYWHCYAGPNSSGAASLFWFVSGEMGGSDHGVLMVAQESNPSAKTPEGCSAAPTNLTGIEFGVPGVGATVSDIEAALGQAKLSEDGHLSFAASFPSAAPDLKDFVVSQTLVYTVKDGKITGISASQVTSN